MNTSDKESLELKEQYQQIHQILQYYLMFDKNRKDFSYEEQ